MEPSPSRGVPQWVAPTVVALAGVWAVGVTVVGQFGVWLLAQALIIGGYSGPALYWPGLSALIALIAGVPAGLAGLLIKRPTCAALVRGWALAAGCAAVLGLARVVPWTAGDTTVSGVAALVAAGLVAAGLVTMDWRPAKRIRFRPPRTGLTGAEIPRVGGVGALTVAPAGLAILLPWWWVGALGGPVDVLAAALAALALGALLARLRRDGPARIPVGGRVTGLLLDALAVAVPSTLLAGAFGPPGAQLALLVVLPASALAVATTDPRRWWPTVSLVAVVAFGPLGLVDAEEVNLLLLPRDVPAWTAIGAGGSAAVALAVGVVLVIVVVVAGSPPSHPARRRALAGALAAALAVASAVSWLGPGQSGFHGDRLFVVLTRQADLTSVARQADHDLAARRTAVYQRLVSHARRTQTPLLSALREVGADATSFYLINAIEVDDTPLVRAVLAGRDDVASIRPSPELRPIPAATTAGTGRVAAPTGPPANLVTIRAPLAWAKGVDGRGVVVGFSDSGVDATHPTLRAGYRAGADSWYDARNQTTNPTDPNGHGTHTAASAVGRTVGVAPGATWIGCANLARPLANPAYYLGCLQFMLAPFRTGGDPLTDGDPTRAADVLSNSWGCPALEGCAADTLEPAINALSAAGIFVVAAAGNTGPRCGSLTDPPARYESTFTVGATNGAGPVASFSGRGPVGGDDEVAKPDLVAPGVDVLSAWPDGGYARLSGTSMAAPQVAGVVALVWQAAPALRGDVERTAALLRASATSVPANSEQANCDGVANVSGAGRVDAQAAVDLARRLGVAPR